MTLVEADEHLGEHLRKAASGPILIIADSGTEINRIYNRIRNNP